MTSKGKYQIETGIYKMEIQGSGQDQRYKFDINMDGT